MIAVLLSPVGSCTLVVFFIARLYFTFKNTTYEITKIPMIILVTLTVIGTLIAQSAVFLYVIGYETISFIGIFVAILFLVVISITVLKMFSNRLFKV